MVWRFTYSGASMWDPSERDSSRRRLHRIPRTIPAAYAFYQQSTDAVTKCTSGQSIPILVRHWWVALWRSQIHQTWLPKILCWPPNPNPYLTSWTRFVFTIPIKWKSLLWVDPTLSGSTSMVKGFGPPLFALPLPVAKTRLSWTQLLEYLVIRLQLMTAKYMLSSRITTIIGQIVWGYHVKVGIGVTGAKISHCNAILAYLRRTFTWAMSGRLGQTFSYKSAEVVSLALSSLGVLLLPNGIVSCINRRC